MVGDEFGIDRMVEESLRLYRGLLAGRAPGEAAASDDWDRPGPGSLVTAKESVG